MKRSYVLALATAMIILTSCGPKRHSCYGKRRCITMQQPEQQQNIIKNNDLA